MAKKKSSDKGAMMEEILRNYFLRAGYFVVRGVPFTFDTFDVTDIDLWLYSRTSSVSREITIVDIKNKKNPQAIERIFWVKGLKQAVDATGAIVATTEKRQSVKIFGRNLGVMVLDGIFLDKLSKSGIGNERLFEEEFTSKIDQYSLGKLDGDWKGRIRLCKTLLSKQLSFDTCNQWLMQAQFFAEQSITKTKQFEIALRCLYLICSYISIAIDFLLKELSFLNLPERISLIKDGFTYGSKGSEGMKKVIDLAMSLVEQNAENGSLISSQVRNNIEKQLSLLNTKILGEYFAKTDVSKNLFMVAREFEHLAMQREFLTHSSGSIELKGMLLCIIDYWGMDRTLFSGIK